MIYLKKYDPSATYMTPSGALMDRAEVLKQFPAAERFSHIVQTDEAGEMMFGFYNLSAMRTQYGVGRTGDEGADITAIQEAMNARADMTPEPSPEERIAAAMEFQNAMNL